MSTKEIEMKPHFFISATIIAAFALAGCEGYRCGTGRVVDRLTNQPLDSVYCEVLTGVATKYTDTSGKFDLCNRISGCVPRCKDITIRFSKPGYKTVSVENPEQAVIYLDR